MEWNDLRDEIGTNIGQYQNPHDLSASTWTLMRFAEVENPKGDLEWLIRKDGCMHCADPGCLKACPAPGAIVQYANGIVDFHEENCIGCGYCIAGCPFDIPRISKKDHKVYKCTLCSAVSYTHLDVYKRQRSHSAAPFGRIDPTALRPQAASNPWKRCRVDCLSTLAGQLLQETE